MPPAGKLPGQARIPHNRASHQLGKHGHIKCQVNKIFLGIFSPVYVHRIADDLKGIKANAHRQRHFQKRDLPSCQGIEILQKKVCILKIHQKAQAHHDRHKGKRTPFPSLPVLFHQQAKAVTGQRGNHHKEHILGFPPAIKNKAAQKQDSIGQPLEKRFQRTCAFQGQKIQPCRNRQKIINKCDT